MKKKFEVILKNATILVEDPGTRKIIQTKASIAVDQGRIAEITTDHLEAQKTYDLKGLTILPGVIDSQVHFREPGLTHKEDIESGTRAALLGGVTSVFEMPNTNPTTSTEQMLKDKLNRSNKNAHCHYAFYMGATSDNAHQLNHLELLPHCPGVKVFLGASFGALLVDNDDVFEQIMKNGRRRVIIHAEDEARLKQRKSIAVDEKHVRVHHIWRDEESALIAVKKSIRFARKYSRPIHILHVSSGDEMALLKQNKNIASVEILPQYLILSAPECYERLGSLAQQNPPIRDKHHLENLWKAVQDGTVDVIGSDHAPHTLEEKAKIYPESPSGVPGVQTLIPLMLEQVHQGRLSLERFTEMVTENPRRLLGVKNKGRIQVGFDADFTIVDLKKQMTITNDWIVSKSKWTPFDGYKVTGWPVAAFLKGKLAMQDNEIVIPHSGEAVEFEF